jgi:hypothetical protein
MNLRNKGVVSSTEYRKKKDKEKRKRLLVWGLLVFFLAALPVVLSHVRSFHISKVRVEGNTVTPGADIEAISNDLMRGNYWYIFPRRNAVIYPEGKIKEIIQRKIPRLSSIDLELEGMKTLVVRVTERPPEALYCEDITSLSTPTGCYFLDEDGFIFSLAPYFSGDVYFLYTRSIPLVDPLGEKLMESDVFQKNQRLVTSLEQIGVHGRALILGEDEHNLILSNGGKIIWNVSDDPEVIAANLDAFLISMLEDDVRFLDKVSYIDLRFQNKVRWSLNNE